MGAICVTHTAPLAYLGHAHPEGPPMDQPTPASLTKPPVAITLTVPLCPARCGFCDLPLGCGDASSAANREAYARALMAEIDTATPDLAAYEVAAVRIAGGAANHLGGAVLNQLMGFLADCAAVPDGCEVSLACVPTGLNIGIFEHLQRRWDLRLEIEYATSEAFLHQGLGRWFPVGPCTTPQRWPVQAAGATSI